MADDSDLNMRKNIGMRDTQYCGMFLPKTLGNQVFKKILVFLPRTLRKTKMFSQYYPCLFSPMFGAKKN